MINLFLLLVIIATIGFAAYLQHTQPKPTFFATSTDGKVIQIQPLSSPALTDAELFAFVKEASIAVTTYNFKSYRQQLSTALNTYFTSEGQSQMRQALSESRNLEAVIEKKLTTKAEITKNPVILRRGTMGGKYAWEVEFGMRIQYGNENPQNYIDQRIIVKMTVIRVPIWQSPIGVGIKSIVVREDIPPPR